MPIVSALPPLDAEQIRNLDAKIIHPSVQFACGFLPPAIRDQALLADSVLFKLMQTPGVLEMALQMLHAKGQLPAGVRVPETTPQSP